MDHNASGNVAPTSCSQRQNTLPTALYRYCTAALPNQGGHRSTAPAASRASAHAWWRSYLICNRTLQSRLVSFCKYINFKERLQGSPGNAPHKICKKMQRCCRSRKEFLPLPTADPKGDADKSKQITHSRERGLACTTAGRVSFIFLR